MTALMLEEIATAVGEYEAAIRAYLKKVVFLDQKPVPIGVPRVDTLVALGPDGHGQIMCRAGELCRDPCIGICPSDGILGCSTKLCQSTVESGNVTCALGRPGQTFSRWRTSP